MAETDMIKYPGALIVSRCLACNGSSETSDKVWSWAAEHAQSTGHRVEVDWRRGRVTLESTIEVTDG